MGAESTSIDGRMGRKKQVPPEKKTRANKSGVLHRIYKTTARDEMLDGLNAHRVFRFSGKLLDKK